MAEINGFFVHLYASFKVGLFFVFRFEGCQVVKNVTPHPPRQTPGVDSRAAFYQSVSKKRETKRDKKVSHIVTDNL